MSRTIEKIILSKQELSELEAIVTVGKHAARKINRARILLYSHQGKRPELVATTLGVSLATVYNVRKRYLTSGLQAALVEKPRSGQPRKVTERVEAAISRIACSDTPQGVARWTVKLINERLITLGYEIEDESVRLVLKKANLNLGSKNSGVLVK
jgi:transposase